MAIVKFIYECDLYQIWYKPGENNQTIISVKDLVLIKSQQGLGKKVNTLEFPLLIIEADDFKTEMDDKANISHTWQYQSGTVELYHNDFGFGFIQRGFNGMDKLIYDHIWGEEYKAEYNKH